jgi:phage terminase large subunit
MIKKDIQFADAFEDLFIPEQYRYKVYYGGRAAAKSTSFARALLIIGTQKPCRVLCTREIQGSIAESVKKLLEGEIKDLGLDKFYNIRRNDIIGRNGTEFLFMGLRSNIESIKSTHDIKYCWIEEATKLTQESLDTLIYSIRGKDSEIWVSFNTGKIDDPIYKTFITEGRDKQLIKKVNYYDNPWFWDTPNAAEMLYDKKNRPDKYMHVWMGEPVAISDSCVFKGFYRVEEFKAPEGTTFYYGMDFGFSQDPTTILRCYVDEDNKQLFIDRAFGKVGVQLDRIPNFCKYNCYGSLNSVVTCDSANPRSIEWLQRNGMPKLRAARKGPNSVEEGVEFLKNYEIIIHERLDDVIYEFGSYSYLVDKRTGQIQNKIIDKHNHFIDALRYAVEDLRRPTSKFKMAGYNKK